MKHHKIMLISTLTTVLLIIGTVKAGNQSGETYEQLWEQAIKLNEDQLPQSALKVVNRIYEKASAEGNQPQMLKALIFSFSLRASFEDEVFKNALTQTEQLVASAAFPVKEIAHSMLAEMYWFYYQINRFRILDRSAVANHNALDPDEWDVTRFRERILYHYQQSLCNQAELETISLKDWQLLLEKPDDEALALQPTLFDFMAGRYLRFLNTADAALQSRLPLTDTLPVDLWLPALSFAVIELPQQAHESILWLGLMQRLITSNIRQGHTEALIYNELQRYSKLQSITANKQAYMQALRNLMEQYPHHGASADVAAELAAFLVHETDLSNIAPSPRAEALRICEQVIKAFPGSRGAARCQIIINDILQQNISIQIQRTEYPGLTIAARINYRNITQAAFRIAKVNSAQLSEIIQQFDPQNKHNMLISLKPLHRWRLDLPFEPDYAEHSAILPLPSLDPGLYVILASPDEGFDKNGILAFASFQVSSLSFMQVNRQGVNTFFVLDRQNGRPVAGVKVKLIVRDYDYKQHKTIEKTVAEYLTSKDGRLIIGPDEPKLPNNQSFYIELSRDEDILMSDNYFDVYRITRSERSQKKTWIFTDRAIYRPGQVVYFKGITLSKEPGNEWILETHWNSTVKMFDVNGREMSSLALKTNDYGSFEGSFVLPSNMLTGQVRLGNEHGMIFIQVEEYKRPTFEVKLLKTEGQPMLGDTVLLQGITQALAGYYIDGAKVEYRVERQAFVPWLPWWRYYPLNDTKQLITTGHTSTAQDGSFSVSFRALPDFSQPQHEAQYYDFHITAWVTDRNGEVRQASTVIRIGNRSLFLSSDLPADLEIKDGKIPRLRLNNLQGHAAEAHTTFKFYRLVPRKAVLRPSVLGAPDRKLMDEKTLQKLFPYDDFSAPLTPESINKIPIASYYLTVKGQAPALPDELAQWPEGDYLAEYICTDHEGNEVRLQKHFTLYSKHSRRSLTGKIFWVSPIEKKLNPGDTLKLWMSSTYAGMRALVEISSVNKLFLRKWVTMGKEKQYIHLVLKPEHMGNLSVQVSAIALNRYFQYVADIRVNNPQRTLGLHVETISERLQPGRLEQWTMRISGQDNKPAQAELLAAMYDASLEQFKPHLWFFDPIPFEPFAQRWMSDNGFATYTSYPINLAQGADISVPELTSPQLNWYGFLSFIFRIPDMPFALARKSIAVTSDERISVEMQNVLQNDGAPQGSTNQNQMPPFDVPAARGLRSDFRETAFFFPQLHTDDMGLVRFSFITPDALTRWRLMLLAHTTDLRVAMQSIDVESGKPLLVVPNLARFYRLGDTAVISAKVVNTGSQSLDGMAMLELSDAISGHPLQLLQHDAGRTFVQLEAGQSTEVRWTVAFNSTAQLLRLRISASTGTFTDAEEHLIHLLPSGIRLTETLPLFVRGNENKSFMLPGLEKPSPSECNLRLKLELTTHPAWVAAKALPYVTDPGYENTDNIFRHFYTNTLAMHVASSISHFDAVLKSWNTSGGLESELTKNQDLKMLATAQTPWLNEAESEQAQRQRLLMFFETQRLLSEKEQSLRKLAELQLPNGLWPWFPGMRGNLWITLSILDGFGKLSLLNASLTSDPEVRGILQKALNYIDGRAVEIYQLSRKKEKDQLSSIVLWLLTTRSYFDLIPISNESREAYAYFEQLARKSWTDFGITDQARLALHFTRWGDKTTARNITASLRERAVRNEKLGLWWKDGEAGNRALSIETHALLVQVFELVDGDRKTADAIRQYLLSQKQTRRWISGPATAEAIYALLMYGSNWTDPGSPVQIKIGGKPVEISNQEAGTGYFSYSWYKQIDNSMARVELANPNPGPVWGGLYRQFEVPVDEVKGSSNEVKITRDILVERSDAAGIRMEPWNTQQLRTGDRIKVRILLETSRDLEFVHLRDLRSPAFEPTDVLSGYQWRNGLGFYQSTRDAFTDFFFDFLPRGKHVFEYGLVVVQRGNFNAGFAQLQSYYAPAFSAFSSGSRIAVD